jgi:hypothetical protein
VLHHSCPALPLGTIMRASRFGGSTFRRTFQRRLNSTRIACQLTRVSVSALCMRARFVLLRFRQLALPARLTVTATARASPPAFLRQTERVQNKLSLPSHFVFCRLPPRLSCHCVVSCRCMVVWRQPVRSSAVTGPRSAHRQFGPPDSLAQTCRAYPLVARVLSTDEQTVRAITK